MAVSKFSTKLLFLILIISFSSQLFATGALFVRPRNSQQTYEKMWIKNINVDVTIQDQVAATKVDQIFKNEMNTSVEAIFIFPLPENAMITELVYWFNGERHIAEIRERQAAINDYNKKLREWLDPALLEYLGDNLFRLSIVPINADTEVRTEITYVELINYDFGVNSYRFLLNTLDLSPKEVETVNLRVNAKSQNLIKFFTSPSHMAEQSTRVIRHSSFHHSLTFGDENYFPDKDLTIEYETVRKDVQYSLLTYTPSVEDSMGDDNFYTLWITPPDSVAEDEIISKDIVFTADVSSSMEGERIFQIKEALTNFVDLLNPEDNFNIITFGTFVNSFKPNLVSVNDTTIQEARNFIQQIYALGMTNISEALDSSINQSYRDYASKNIVFFTDGRPTIGETLPSEIVASVNEANLNDVKLFAYGVGDDVNKGLLTQLSKENSGYATFIKEDENISRLITDHFTRISKPVLTDISIDYGVLSLWDTYPKITEDIYWGKQTMAMGLYRTGGEFPVTLNATVNGEPVQFSKNMNFKDTGGYRFVPRLWAKAKINHLLDMIEIYGENEELVDQVIELSLRFQILTKYTAFYSDPTDVDDDNEATPNDFKLYQNYPNPFNPETTIKYSIPQEVKGERSKVKITVYDLLGRLVAVLTDGYKQPGIHEVTFNASNLPSGVYLYKIVAGKYSDTKKMIVLK